jgi:SAM-dependent methyltransferase
MDNNGPWRERFKVRPIPIVEGVIAGFLVALISYAAARVSWLIACSLGLALLVGFTVARVLQRAAAVQVYGKRKWSDDPFLRDITRYQHAAFIGISHPNLPLYLEQAAKRANNSVLETVDVYFPKTIDGELWEGRSFLAATRHSRLEISAMLTSPEIARSLPRLREIRFLRMAHHPTYGGCVLGHNGDLPLVQYAVLYLPSEDKDLKTTLTLRVLHNRRHLLGTSVEELNEALFESYKVITHQAASIGCVQPSIWDISVESWDSFTSQCEGYSQSMKTLVELSKIKDGESVLDLGAGCGSTTQIIRDRAPHAKLTLLDSSPQMLHRAKIRFGESAEYVLCKLPGLLGEQPMDLEHHSQFDHIVLHLALPSIASTKRDLESVATWSRQWLKREGRFTIAAHNTVVTNDLVSYRPETDEFRTRLLAAARKRCVENTRNDPREQCLSPNDVTTAFSEAGFRLEETKASSYPWTMNDRILMWQTPAVLDRLIDAKSVPVDVRKAILQEVKQHVDGQGTAPLAVTFFVFVLDKSKAGVATSSLVRNQ